MRLEEPRTKNLEPQPVILRSGVRHQADEVTKNLGGAMSHFSGSPRFFAMLRMTKGEACR